MDRVLLPKADVVIDIHSGGTSLDFVPCVVIHELASESQMQATTEAMLAFGAPYGLILKELDAEGLLDTAAESKGKVFLSTELRGAGSVSPFAVQVGDNGLCNVLKHFGAADIGRSSYTSYSCTRTQKLLRIPDESCFQAAVENGLYEPLKELGEQVSAGEVIGQIHFVANLNRAPRLVMAAESGTLICRRVQGRVEAGDCVAVIGVP